MNPHPLSKPDTKDWKLHVCSMCRTIVVDAVEGTPCPSPACSSFVVAVRSGKRKGQLHWHHPLECEEIPGPCWFCSLMNPQPYDGTLSTLVVNG